MSEVGKIARGLTKLRRDALLEIGEAGVLGFGKCSLAARKYLLSAGLSERLPSEGMFVVCKERLTPLGRAVRAHLKEQQP